MPCDTTQGLINLSIFFNADEGLAGYWINAKVMLATMKMKQQQQRNQRQKYMHNQQLRIQRRCG